jgi:hypothetical protein
MTSPALLYLSLDTHSISEAFTATTAAEAVILAAPESPAGSYTAIKANPRDASGLRRDAACRPERVRVSPRRAEL